MEMTVTPFCYRIVDRTYTFLISSCSDCNEISNQIKFEGQEEKIFKIIDVIELPQAM